MRSFNLLRLFAFVVLTFVAAGNLVAGIVNTIAIDEFGHGTQTGFGSLPSSTSAIDPLSGIATVQYTLPIFVTPGDVILTEPGTSSQTLSDLVRFETIPGSNLTAIYFFSDASQSDPIDAPADHFVFPTTFQTNLVTAGETGLEIGPNGLLYVPSVGAPGSLPTGALINYNIVSDGTVPEPSSSVLFGLGAVSLLFVARCRRKVA